MYHTWLSEKENEIFNNAIGYWIYPTHKKEIIEALEQWEYVMKIGADSIDMKEAKLTRKLINKMKKDFKIK